MKKKFFFKFFLFTVFATLVTFTACKDYDDDIDMLDGKIETVSGDLSAAKADLTSKIEAVKSELTTMMNGKIDALNGEITSLKSDLADLETELGTKASQADLDALNVKIDDVKDEILQKTVLKEVFNTFKGQTETALSNLRTDLNTKVSQADFNDYKLEVNGKLTTIQGTLATLGGRLTTLEDVTLPQLRQELLDSLSVAVVGLQDEISALKSELEPRIITLESILQVNDEGESDVIADIYGELGDQLVKINNNTAEITALKDSLESKFNQLVAVDEDLQAQITVNKGLIEDNQTAITIINTYIENDLKPRLNGIEGDISDLQGDVGVLQFNVGVLQDEVADLITAVEKMMLMFEKRITSVTLNSNHHVNGVRAIDFQSLGFTPQELIGLEDQDMYGFTTADLAGASAVTATDNSTIAEFRLSPRYVSKESIKFPYFESIIATNRTRAVSESNTGVNTPIAPVAGQELEITSEGILRLKITKTIAESMATEDVNSQTEKFYYVNLALPIADEFLTEEEKDNNGAVISSEQFRVDEIITTPRIKSAVAGNIDHAYDTNGVLVTATQPSELHYYPYALDADGKPVHYSSASMLYNSASNANIDEEVFWNGELDLNTLVTVGREEDHTTVENFADYGLEFKFEVAEDDYLLDGVNQQDFVSIDDEGILTSKVGPNDETPLGRQPIIKVTLHKDGNVVDVRFIKVKFVLEPVGPVAIEFPSRDAECDTVQFIADNATMLAEFYTPTNLTNAEFHDRYVWETGVAPASVGTVAVVDGNLVWTLNPTEQEANMGNIISQTGTFTYDGHVIEVTLESNITQPEIALQGLIDNYWFNDNTYVKFNTATPAVGDTDPDNNTFVTNINNIFQTDGSGDIILPAGYTYEYVFVDIAEQPVQEYGEGADKITISVSADGKELLATKGTTTSKVAVIDNNNRLHYASNNISKELLNVDAEFMKARLSVKVYNECGLELKVTGLGNDDAFNVHFLRPVNIEGKSPEAFVDAVDFGAEGSIIELEKLVKLADWRNYAKDTDQYFFDPNNPTYYDYYDVSAITVNTADIVPVGLQVDGVDINTLPSTIKVETAVGVPYGTLTYRNNGANLSGDFTLLVPVTVTYKWGDVTTIVEVVVKKTSGL